MNQPTEETKKIKREMISVAFTFVIQDKINRENRIFP
jgi:hypothetical protein